MEKRCVVCIPQGEGKKPKVIRPYPVTLESPLSEFSPGGKVLAEKASRVAGVSTGEVPLLVIDSTGDKTVIKVSMRDGQWEEVSFCGFYKEGKGWENWDTMVSESTSFLKPRRR